MLRVFLILLAGAPLAIAARCGNMTGCRCERMQPDRFPVRWGLSGFGNGRGAFPNHLPVLADIKKDFGARGDGVADDTQAFRSAGARVFGRPGFISVPAGTYIITSPMEWTTDAMFRGEGPSQSVLLFPRTLKEVLGPNRSYGYGPFFITIQSALPKNQIWTVADVRLPLPAGSTTVCLSGSAARVRAGTAVFVVAQDQQGGRGIQRELHGGAAIGMGQPTPYSDRIKYYARVLSIDTRTACLVLDKPAPISYRLGWKAFLTSSGDTLQGASDMGFMFMPWPFPGHTRELGRNALLIKDLSSTYMRNLAFYNTEFGMYVVACHSSTFSNIEFHSSNPPDMPDAQGAWEFGSTGHYGIQVYGGAYNRLERITFRTKFVHDLSVTDLAIGTVFASVSGIDLVMDHHRGAPMATLWQDIDIGQGSRPLRCFGNAKYGPPAGAFTTFYNIRARGRLGVWVHKIQDQLGANINWIGVDFAQPSPHPTLSFGRIGWRYDSNNTDLEPRTLDCFR